MNYLITHIGSVGLVLDLIGATFIFRFVLTAGEQVILIDETEERERKRKVRTKTVLAWTGFGLIVLGFLFQLASNEMNIYKSENQKSKTECLGK